MTAYTVVESWRGLQVTGGLVSQLTTEPFTLRGKPWAIVWSLRGSGLRVMVNDPQGKSPVSACVAVNMHQGGQGVSYIYDSGTFNLSIDALGEWVVKLVAIDNWDGGPADGGLVTDW